MPGSELRKKIRGRARENVLLSDYMAYRIGGPADFFVEPGSPEDIPTTLEFCRQHAIACTVVGNGTNMLVRDGGIRGVTLYLGSALTGAAEILRESEKEVRLRVPAHWAKARLLDWALENEWGGLEFSAGIPGTLGGAVYMNAGTKWGSYSEVIEAVEFFSADHGFYERSAAELGFKYRGHGEGMLSAETVIVAVRIRLLKDTSGVELRAKVDEILEYRGGKQPLELPNCGSVFKNPEHSAQGAGRLIEACGLKGRVQGRAKISEKHANFILNLGGARAAHVESLIETIQATVLREKGVQLETEVIRVGER